MRLYFVTIGHKTEIAAIKVVRPDNLLASYFYWRRRDFKPFFEAVGYKPQILLDSGAYSAKGNGTNINVLDYADFIHANAGYIDEYISLDVIGEPDLTFKLFEVLKLRGLNPIPVYHYGSDIKYLMQYIEMGEKRIALGNAVPIKNKALVVEWVNNVLSMGGGVSYHLLGSSSKLIIANCPGLDSCDSSAYFMRAAKREPAHIGNVIDRAIYHMQLIQGLVS